MALHCCWVTAHLYQQQISLSVFAGPSLLSAHSSTEQGAIAKSSVALHCWVTAHLYQQQTSIVYLQWPKPAVSLVCTAALSRGQSFKSSVALHCCWVTAHLYQQQISLSVFAVAQACCQPVLHSSTEQGGNCQEQCGTALLLGHCTPIPTANLPKCICSGPSLLSAWFAQQH